MTGLFVEQAGPRTTVQDNGRSGYQHQGLSPGGAADLRAFRWANLLLGNPTSAACLEITLGGFVAVADSSLLLSLTGADCQARMNGAPVANWGVFGMEPGDRLQLQPPRSGLLTYLAVYGGWQTKKFCGSRSVVLREGLRGLGLVRGGDVVPAEAATGVHVDALLRRTVPPQLRPDLGTKRPLKLIPGPDVRDFNPADITRFLHSDYTVSQQSDRMGYRLEGPPLANPGGVTSRGVTCGTVQVPGDGRPMVLLNDRQTIGGYPVLGTVPRLDCSRLSQCRPGDTLSFAWADVADCQSERMVFEQQMRISRWTEGGELVHDRPGLPP